MSKRTVKITLEMEVEFDVFDGNTKLDDPSVETEEDWAECGEAMANQFENDMLQMSYHHFKLLKHKTSYEEKKE